jgi:hypothetical protein
LPPVGPEQRKGGVALGAGQGASGATLTFKGPSAQGFNSHVEGGPILARNAQGNLLRVGGCRLQVGANWWNWGLRLGFRPGSPLVTMWGNVTCTSCSNK